MYAMHSGLQISQTDSRPMYLQILEQIRLRIVAGDWAPGKELPSIRALAADLSVSVITVKRAYLDLESAGVIVTRHGKGSFVAEAGGPASALQTARLDDHLDAAAEAGRVLGFSDKELMDRLRSALRRLDGK